jgi:HD-GYP domain-containing protein (c-di-GMP phosphodiesterase class II)
MSHLSINALLSKNPSRIKLVLLGGFLNLTLLVEGNLKIESFYMLNLSVWLGLETVTCQRAQNAIQLLDSSSTKFNLIVVRAIIGKEESAKLIIEYLKSKNSTTPVIVIGPGKEVPGSFAHVANSLQLKALIQSAAKALHITAKNMNDKIVPDYFPIPINYFTVIKRSICPVFAQDVSDPSLYNLRIDKLKNFEDGLVKSLIGEGIQRLYVDKLDRLEFVNNVTSELMSQLEKEEISPDEQISANEKSVELLVKKLAAIGVNEETIVLAKKNIETMKAQVKTYPKLAKLLDRLLSNKTSYLYRHTQIMIFVALHIIKNIDWGNPEQEEKITFICFFHDIALDNDEHAQIRSALELKKLDLPIHEKQLIEKHAQLAAEIVQKFPHAPMGADQIIRQHHGTLNGMGFSEHYGNNVSPVAIVFIVSEEFTRIILRRGEGPFDRTEMIRELRDSFPTSRFQKVVDILQSITIYSFSQRV